MGAQEIPLRCPPDWQTPAKLATRKVQFLDDPVAVAPYTHYVLDLSDPPWSWQKVRFAAVETDGRLFLMLLGL